MKIMSPPQTNPHFALVVALALGQGVVGYASAQEAQKAAVNPKPMPAAASGVTVAIDPVTKQIRPLTAEEAAALAAPQKSSASPAFVSRKPVPMLYPDGHVSLKLPESSMESLVATKGQDGKVTIRSVNNRDLDAALAAPANLKPAAPVQNVRSEEK
jgi:hypothetical protein